MNALTFYWINLERSLARRSRMEQQFAEHNVRNVRVLAIDGVQEKLYENGKAILRKTHGKTTNELNAELGCTLSHLKAIYEFLQSTESCAVISEDDLSFELLHRHPVSLDARLLDGNGDILMLAVITCKMLNQRAPWEIVDYDGRIHCSALAYMLNRTAAEKILASVKKTPQGLYDFSSSSHVSESVIFSHVKTRLLLPPLFTYPSRNESLIHPSHLPMHLASKRRFESWYTLNTEKKNEIAVCPQVLRKDLEKREETHRKSIAPAAAASTTEKTVSIHSGTWSARKKSSVLVNLLRVAKNQNH